MHGTPTAKKNVQSVYCVEVWYGVDVVLQPLIARALRVSMPSIVLNYKSTHIFYQVF